MFRNFIIQFDDAKKRIFFHSIVFSDDFNGSDFYLWIFFHFFLQNLYRENFLKMFFSSVTNNMNFCHFIFFCFYRKSIHFFCHNGKTVTYQQQSLSYIRFDFQFSIFFCLFVCSFCLIFRYSFDLPIKRVTRKKNQKYDDDDDLPI